jgi:hypothetical protein
MPARRFLQSTSLCPAILSESRATRNAINPEGKALGRFLRLRASAVSLTLALRLERLLEVLGINASSCPLLPSHLRSLRLVRLNELSSQCKYQAVTSLVEYAAHGLRRLLPKREFDAWPKAVRTIQTEILGAIAVHLLTVPPYHLE